MTAPPLTIPTKAISIRAPWWWAVLHLRKDIENRVWRSDFRGPVLLHASKWYRPQVVMEDAEDAALMLRRSSGYSPPDSLFPKDAAGKPIRRLTHDMLRPSCGCIVGMVDVVDCVSRRNSPWFVGPYGFVLWGPVALNNPIPCKGMLGFFTVPEEIRELVAAQVTETVDA